MADALDWWSDEAVASIKRLANDTGVCWVLYRRHGETYHTDTPVFRHVRGDLIRNLVRPEWVAAIVKPHPSRVDESRQRIRNEDSDITRYVFVRVITADAPEETA